MFIDSSFLLYLIYSPITYFFLDYTNPLPIPHPHSPPTTIYSLLFEVSHHSSHIVVTLYATLGEEGIRHAINETQVKYIVTTTDLIQHFKVFS